MTKRPILTALTLIGIGIAFGVVLMTNFGSNALESLLAKGVGDLGAKTPPIVLPENVKALNNAFVSASDAVKKNVVSITVKTEQKGGQVMPRDFFRFFGPDGQEEDQDVQPREGEQGGSGVIITADGYVVTNNHVVEDAKENGITVTTFDEKEYKAKLVGRDPLTDLAVLKIEGQFQAAHLADRRNVRVGEWVIAVGAPLGLKQTVTTGIVSAEGRGIGIIGTDEMRGTRNRFSVENFIQTDAAINPGNSGGGLFNLEGSLVGINTAIASRSGVNAGYGFAIPIDMVKSVALDLIDDGKIERGYIGVEITSVDETAAKTVGLQRVAGVMVNKVVKGGAAAAAGLEEGDVILDVDGTPVKTSNELQNQIVLHRAGDRVTLKIWRDRKEISKTVTLKSLDDNGAFAEASNDGKSGDRPSSSADPVTFKDLGFTASPLTEDVKRDLDTKQGVLVTKVDARGVVARRGLQSGAVILKADGQIVNNPSDLKRILSNKAGGDGVMFVVKTRDGKQAITVQVPES